MISPDEIREKAERRYRDLLKTWLAEGSATALFPLVFRFRHIGKGDDYAATLAAVSELRKGSKECLGYGYRVEWREIRSREFGRNKFPERILFETPADYLRTIEREMAFQRFTDTVGEIRRQFPQLESWIASHLKLTIDIAEEEIANGLLAVCRYLVDHPRPDCFARELPVAVDTKFVERHARKILRPWLDCILPPDAIRADEEHFDRRFGLAYAEPLIRMRFLDRALQERLGFRHSELALPLGAAARAISIAEDELPPTVFVAENLVNALTLPEFSNGMALAGLGYSVNLFRYLTWLRDCPDIRYWGDIDAQGFEILSQFRTWFPQVKSILMDVATAEQFSRFRVEGVPPRTDGPNHLTEQESALHRDCRSQNWRLEQEKIPQDWVVGCLDESERGPSALSR